MENIPLTTRTDIFKTLQTDILSLQGMKPSNNSGLDHQLGPIRFAFPHATFPLGAVHEFLAPTIKDTAPTAGFISGLLTAIVKDGGVALWISTLRKLFTPALKNFHLQPDHFIFIDLQKEKDVAWAVDEALKCNSIAAVVAELREMDFVTSRRLQLAVEQSGVTGFVIRSHLRNLSATACAARWKITTLPSQPVDDLPGIGYPKWRVELLRVRNGKPGMWEVQWTNGKFVHEPMLPSMLEVQQKKAV